MKKYLVIGNPIEHSLSPRIHNYWFKKNNINAVYEKKLVKKDEIEKFIKKLKNKEIDGINVTVPFKKVVIPFLDQLTTEARITQSVNTIYIFCLFEVKLTSLKRDCVWLSYVNC